MDKSREISTWGKRYSSIQSVTGMKRGGALLYFFYRLGLVCIVWQLFGIPEGASGTLSVLKQHIGPSDAVIVADASARILFARNAQKQLIPASTLKVFTSLMALNYLGADYQCKTEFYIDSANNLKIKGYGDPLLISEVITGIAVELKRHLIAAGIEITRLNNIFLDDTFFNASIDIPGISSSLEPYDAPNGALCVNFNTVNFTKTATGKYTSAEPQTPLLPFVLKKVMLSGMNQGRILLSSRNRELLLYAGHLFRYFFEQHGLKMHGRILPGRADPTSDRLVYTYNSSFTVVDLIQKCLEFSNNFIANQLFILCGITAFNPPGTLKKGVLAARKFAAGQLKLPHVQIVEGSGISRQNGVSAAMLLKILHAFAPYHTLMRQDGRQFFKTGTLDGIRTRVGYIKGGDGMLYRFVILINSPGKSPTKILTILEKSLP